MKKLRTLMLSQLEHKPNGPFIAGEDMVSYLWGKEISQGFTAYLLEGHICRNEKEAVELYHRYIKTIIYNISKKKGGFFSIPTFGDKE